MKKFKINYTDGTSKEVVVKRVHVRFVPEEEERVNFNMMSVKDGVTIDVSSNLIPDLRFIKNMEFIDYETPGGME